MYRSGVTVHIRVAGAPVSALAKVCGVADWGGDQAPGLGDQDVCLAGESHRPRHDVEGFVMFTVDVLGRAAPARR
jgi:hypothetical protein